MRNPPFTSTSDPVTQADSSEDRNNAHLFRQAIGAKSVPGRVVIDQSGANLTDLSAVNAILKLTDCGRMIELQLAI